MRIELVRGDLTTQDVDAVVNAANSSLLGGGGVDGALHRAAGPDLLAQCEALRRTTYPSGLPTGDAVATGGGRLAARWVIHTVGPVYGSTGGRDAELLASCHVRSLAVADAVGARTVAFPAISCGVYRYPLHEAAGIASRAVRGADTAVEVVRFVLFGADAFAAFSAAAGSP